jgi:hypothetical protein
MQRTDGRSTLGAASRTTVSTTFTTLVGGSQGAFSLVGEVQACRQRAFRERYTRVEASMAGQPGILSLSRKTGAKLLKVSRNEP